MLRTTSSLPMAGLLFLAVSLAGGAGCDAGGDGEVNECPDVIKVNPGAGIHGQPCETAADCEYGVCIASQSITGGTVKFCTKSCKCGIGSECNDDPSLRAGLEAKCVRVPIAATGEPITSFCAQECQSVADCKVLDERYNRCELPQSIHGSVGARKVCLIDPNL